MEDSQIVVKTLLGRMNLDFSIHCLSSFLSCCCQPVQLHIFDDGTLEDEQVQQLTQSLPGSLVISRQEREQFVLDKLKDFPQCLSFRNSNVLSLKLFDVMFYSTDDLLFVDSDVFFVKPFKWPSLKDNTPIFMKDIHHAYSYSIKQFIKRPIGIYGFVNTGFFYFPANSYNLSEIETILKACKPDETPSFRKGWIEQTIWASLAAQCPKIYLLNSKQFIIPDKRLLIDEKAVAVHLVSNRRFFYDDIKFIKPGKEVLPEMIQFDIQKKKLKNVSFLKEKLYKRLRTSIKCYWDKWIKYVN